MIQNYLSLGKLDPSPLFDTIEKHFPIGVMRRTEEEQRVYETYPGLKLYSEAIEDAIHEKTSFEGIWRPVEDDLASKTGLRVVGTTYGQAPCYSSLFKVRHEQFGNLTRHFDIHVFVSVIGPYYTVIGKDWSEIVLADSVLRPTNFYLLSPIGKDAILFTTAVEVLKTHFPSYRLVPHCFYSQRIPDFQVPYSDEELNSVFNGIFNQEYDFRGLVVGDSFYGSETWFRDNYDPPQGSWTLHPPYGA